MPHRRSPAEEQIEKRQHKLGRRRNDRIQSLALPAALVVMIAAIAISIGSLKSDSNQDKTNKEQDETAARLTKTIEGVCTRLQRQREQSNVSEARMYLILYTITNSPTASEQTKTFFGDYINSAKYFPPTICNEAVLNPKTQQVSPPGIKYVDLGFEFAQSVNKASTATVSGTRVTQPVPDCWTKYKKCPAPPTGGTKAKP